MPVTVGTTTSVGATKIMSQQKVIYASGRWWIFYSDGTWLVYRTSADGGATWSDATNLRSGNNGYVMSVHFDGTFLHYAYAENLHLFYRRGTPNTDGTITWGAAEQTVLAVAGGDFCSFPAITVDTDGYPWITYIFHAVVPGPTDTPYIIKSSENDGTWTTDFNTQLSVTSSDEHFALPIALTSNKVYVLYGANNETVRGNLYDGGWGGQEIASTTLMYFGMKSACAEGDDVHVVFQGRNGAASRLIYIKRTDATWSAETDIRDGDGTWNIRGTIGVDNAGYVYITSHIGASLQLHRFRAAWQIIRTYTETQVGSNVPSITITEYSHQMALLWAAGAASPYDMRFVTVGVPRASTAVAPHTF